VTLHVETDISPGGAPTPVPGNVHSAVLAGSGLPGRARFAGVAALAPTSTPVSPLRGPAVQPLRLNARLANESSPAVAQSAELVASVTLGFRVEPFPSIPSS